MSRYDLLPAAALTVFLAMFVFFTWWTIALDNKQSARQERYEAYYTECMSTSPQKDAIAQAEYMKACTYLAQENSHVE
jgi:hypothetical protein